jgi:hypothetical protein
LPNPSIESGNACVVRWEDGRGKNPLDEGNNENLIARYGLGDSRGQEVIGFSSHERVSRDGILFIYVFFNDRVVSLDVMTSYVRLIIEE